MGCLETVPLSAPDTGSAWVELLTLITQDFRAASACVVACSLPPVPTMLKSGISLKLFVMQIHCKCLSRSKEAEKPTTDRAANQPNASQMGKTAEMFEGLGLTQTGFTICFPSCSLMPQTS